jgi:hypothetical protein
MPPDVRRGKAFDQILRQMLCPYPSSGCGVIARFFHAVARLKSWVDSATLGQSNIMGMSCKLRQLPVSLAPCIHWLNI